VKKYAVIPALLADDGQYGSYAEEEQTGQKRIYEIGSTLERLGIVHENKNRPKREWLLNRVRHIDDDVAEALYSTNRSVPTYTKSQITPLKNNYNGATPDPSYIPEWHLTLDASLPVSRKSLRIIGQNEDIRTTTGSR
jgi:hypothetical protein